MPSFFVETICSYPIDEFVERELAVVRQVDTMDGAVRERSNQVTDKV